MERLPADLKVGDPLAPGINQKMKKPSLFSHYRSAVEPRWEAWGEKAGFDKWEQLVLRCRLSEKSRDKALAEQPDDESRRKLQAAWRKFDRSGLDRLRMAAEK